jgi:hypothetical protein
MARRVAGKERSAPASRSIALTRGNFSRQQQIHSQDDATLLRVFFYIIDCAS